MSRSVLKIEELGLEPFEQTLKDGTVVLRRAINTEKGVIFVTEDKLSQILKAQGIKLSTLLKAPQDYSVAVTDPEFRKKGKVYKYQDADGKTQETEPQTADNIRCKRFRFIETGMTSAIVSEVAASLLAQFNFGGAPVKAAAKAAVEDDIEIEDDL